MSRRGDRTAVVMLLVLLASGIVVAAQQSPACTITVLEGESIMAAVTAAPEGSVICLAEGCWEESLMIFKSLTLRGMGKEKTVIRPSPGGLPACISIACLGEDPIEVTVEQLGIGDGGDEVSGILITDNAHVTIDTCSIFNNYNGIRLKVSAQATVVETIFSQNLMFGVILTDAASAIISDSTFVDDSGGAGVFESAELTVRSCDFSEGFEAIEIAGSARLSMADSTISGGWQGIMVRENAEAVIDGSTIFGSFKHGINLSDSASVTITGSHVTGMDMGYGIYAEGSSRLTVTGCSFADNGCGILLEISSTGTIVDSSLCDGTEGIVLTGEVNASITRCTISDNVRGVTIANWPQISISNNSILRNEQYGIALFEAGCLPDLDAYTAGTIVEIGPMAITFLGFVEGGGNTVPAPGEINANQGCAVCPDELGFLMTDEGGELDRQLE